MSNDSFPSLGSAANSIGQQVLGAEVVSKTLDFMNNSSDSGNSFAPVDKQTFGAAVVSKTLDYMNSGSMGGMGGASDMSQSYQFGKDVLGAYMSGTGALANTYA